MLTRYAASRLSEPEINRLAATALGWKHVPDRNGWFDPTEKQCLCNGYFDPCGNAGHMQAIQAELLRRKAIRRYAAILVELVTGVDEWPDRYKPGKHERIDVADIDALLGATLLQRTLAFVLLMDEIGGPK